MTQEQGFLPRRDFDRLLAVLEAAGFRCLGPRLDEGVIVYREIRGLSDLPRGYRDRQGPGHYRLEASESERCFAWASGPQALKPLVFAPWESLWTVVRDARGGVRFQPRLPQVPPQAVFGVRACDLAALALLDRHFLARSPDPAYQRRRDSLFLVAVNCTHPAATCFCVATGDGPCCRQGYDLLLDELDEGFLIQAGSERGAEMLSGLDLARPSAAQRARARQQQQGARESQEPLDFPTPADRLRRRAEHPHWQAVAQRCLACGNCTAVCPTCFCHDQHDEPALEGQESEHLRQWGSCFSPAHSALHGLVVRNEIGHRYRQWLTHKWDYWHDQYGRGGCVGCGRCITWCPVGIDLREELARLLEEQA